MADARHAIAEQGRRRARLAPGQTFDDAESIGALVRLHCHASGHLWRAARKDKRRLSYKCKCQPRSKREAFGGAAADGEEGGDAQVCAYHVTAARASPHVPWKIRSSTLDHTCTEAHLQALATKSRNSALLDKDLATFAAAEVRNHPNRVRGASQRVCQALAGMGLPAPPKKQLMRVINAERARLVGHGGINKFEYLESWLLAMTEADPDAVAELDVTELAPVGAGGGEGTRHYNSVFIVPGCAARLAKCGHLRPYVTIDATFTEFKTTRMTRTLRVKSGAVLTLIATDAGNRLLPLAVAHTSRESLTKWKWFLERCRAHLGQTAQSLLRHPDLVVSSDGFAGLEDAIHQILPEAHHIFCFVHRKVRSAHSQLVACCVLHAGVSCPASASAHAGSRVRYRVQRNLADFLTRNGFSVEDSDVILSLHARAASAFDPFEYEEAMHELELLSPEVHTFLLARDPEKWARSHIPVCHYGKYTSNDAEAVNATYASFKTSAEVFRMLRLIVEDISRRYVCA